MTELPVPYRHLPSEEYCLQQHAICERLIQQDQQFLELVGGWRPTHWGAGVGWFTPGEHQAGGWRAKQLAQRIENTKQLRRVWDLAWHVTARYVNDQHRDESAAQLWDLVGPAAYITGQLPHALGGD